MSVYANNEYIICANNSINENKYNAEKMKNYGLKALIKPLMKIIKKSSKHARSQKQRCFNDDLSFEQDQNSANESLERQLVSEMESCSRNAAIFVYGEDDSCEVVPAAGRATVPVHFARTEAGTFFWTSVMKAADDDFAPAGHCYTECQAPAQQMPFYGQDRWVQA